MARPKKGVEKDGLKFVGHEGGRLKYETRLRLRHGGKLRERQRTILAESARDAEQQRAALLEQFQAELDAKDQGVGATVSVLVEQWLETLRHSTRVTYTSYFRHFERAFGARPVADLTSRELQAFLAELALSDHTVNCMRGAYCVFFAWAKRQGHITDDAMRATERRKSSLTDDQLMESVRNAPASRAMTHDEITVFMRTFEQVDPEVYLIFATQFLLGCRIGEAIALHWSDLDEATGRVVLRHNFSKGRLSVPKAKRARLTALAPRWIEKLQAHRARLIDEGRPMADALVFPAPGRHIERRREAHNFWYYRGLYQRFVEVLQSCGITLAPRTATHAMRHTLISLVRSESQQVVGSRLVGVSVGPGARDDELRRRVGHSTASLTEHYTSVPAGKLVDLSEQVASLLNPPSSRRRPGPRNER